MSLIERLRAVGNRRGARPASPPGPWVLLAAWGPCGFSPVAPGTVGTLGAVPLWWALSWLPGVAHLAAIVVLTLLGVLAAGRAGRYWGVTDASAIVIDEVVGYLVTVALVPFSWRAAALGFVLFRLFDVTKPWPVSVLDRVKSAWGVMLDDVVAGVYAMAILHAALRWLPEVF
ncbi:MAG TPA: phosphatidylglycerophosphatase A [Anaeromyxobacteraceae bacterium]|nr:phosphatidylglycerophosphatase A [Anaeromyxobacteraceae bacterium]